MDKQEVFNRVATHLLTQNKKSTALGSSSRCMYRSPENLKCAVGCLIADEHYLADFDEDGGKLASSSVIVNALKLSGIEVINNEETEFLRDLQELHDYNKVHDWPEMLRKLATKYEFKLPEILKNING